MYIKKVACKIPYYNFLSFFLFTSLLDCNFFYSEIIPVFFKPLYSTQFTSVTSSCTKVQILLLSHPALSGHVNLVTSGTKMQLAKGYISLSWAQGSGRTCQKDLQQIRALKLGLFPGLLCPALLPLPETETMLPVVGCLPDSCSVWFDFVYF